MSMLVVDMAFHAKIEVFASGACNELMLRQHNYAAVASTSSGAWFLGNSLDIFGEGAWDVFANSRLGGWSWACHAW